jgi:4-diphosphocytidyl-2-C-methyl-D-erythritol kinase
VAVVVAVNATQDRPMRERDSALHPVVRVAPAKVNLTLAIGRRRPDGYHDLHSVMVPIGLADRLSLAPAHAERDTLHVTGDDSAPRSDDLVLRGIAAARAAVQRALGPSFVAFPLAARLEKRIPLAAGLAGGSSDAAAAFEGALEAWGAELAGRDRLAAAASVGSDVAFFLAEGPALVEGRGERITPLPAPIGAAIGILVITPPIAVSTAEAFARLDADPAAAPADPRSTRLTSEHLAQELRAGLRAADLVARAGVLSTANDLVNAAAALVPELRSFRRALARKLARPIGQSGSGPSLWALYPSASDAEAAGAELAEALASGEIGSPPGTPRITATSILGPAAGRDA